MPADRPDMTPAEQAVWCALQRHLGRAQAVTVEQLAATTGLSDRRVRRAVKALVEVHRIAIASSPHRPAGYCLPLTAEDVLETYRSLRGRALSILHRAAVLRRQSLPALLGQLALEIAEQEARCGR